jgi:hypothetical protein
MRFSFVLGHETPVCAGFYEPPEEGTAGNEGSATANLYAFSRAMTLAEARA